MADADGHVTFTVKELLAKLDSKLDDVLARIELKASQESVDHLDTRLTRVEREVASLKNYKAAIGSGIAIAVFVVPFGIAALFHYT